jgi:hypothetical protein
MIWEEPDRRQEKRMHYFADSTVRFGCIVLLFISACSATRKKLCIGQNAAFYTSNILDSLLYFEYTVHPQKLCIRQ